MFFNDTNLAVLRVLAAADVALTVREVAGQLPDHGWVPRARNHPADAGPSIGSVRSALSALEWNEGIRDWSGDYPRAKPLAVRSGRASRSTTWEITGDGRSLIEAEDARLAKDATS